MNGTKRELGSMLRYERKRHSGRKVWTWRIALEDGTRLVLGRMPYAYDLALFSWSWDEQYELRQVTHDDAATTIDFRLVVRSTETPTY